MRAGLDAYTGDAVAVIWPTAPTIPEDLVRYHHGLEEGWECVFGSRFIRGARVRSYPRLKMLIDRLANCFIRAIFRYHYNDTTNAFKAYRREVIDAIHPLLSNHFNLTVEMPLKAIVRGHSFRVVPISWTGRIRRRLQARHPRDGQPLPLHRALRLAGASPQPGGLPSPDSEDFEAVRRRPVGQALAETDPVGKLRRMPTPDRAEGEVGAPSQPGREFGSSAFLASLALAGSFAALGLNSISISRIEGATGRG